MDELVVRTIQEKDKVKIEEFINQYHLKDMDTHGMGLLIEYDNWEDFFEKVKGEENRPSKGRVEATQLITVRSSDEKVIGVIQIRHRLNDHLLKYGGHIGYGILKNERRKGYGKEQLVQALQYAKNVLGLKDVLITCKVSNRASSKLIRSLEGIKENEIYNPDDQSMMERYWIALQ